MKTCPTCGAFFSLEDLLSSPDVVPVGMTSDEEEEPESLYYFTHRVPGCGTTFTIPATAFRTFIDEIIPEEIKSGQATCRGLCSRIQELELCDNNCHWAPYRRLLLEMVRRRIQSNSTAK